MGTARERSRRRARVRCAAVLLDAAGVIVLPNPGLVSGGLAAIGIELDPGAVAAAHYRAVRALDRIAPTRDAPDAYAPALSAALAIPASRESEAAEAIRRLADRGTSGENLWSHGPPGSREVIEALQTVGIAVVILTNSDGHAAENLRDAGICQAGPGPGAAVTAVIDSALVGAAKPDRRIFEIALERAGATPGKVVHVGDRLATDVAGAEAAGIAAIHLDPFRRCRAIEHRHIRTLAGLWQHVARPECGSR